jgi:hypothetical protein
VEEVKAYLRDCFVGAVPMVVGVGVTKEVVELPMMQGPNPNEGMEVAVIIMPGTLTMEDVAQGRTTITCEDHLVATMDPVLDEATLQIAQTEEEEDKEGMTGILSIEVVKVKAVIGVRTVNVASSRPRCLQKSRSRIHLTLKSLMRS